MTIVALLFSPAFTSTAGSALRSMLMSGGTEERSEEHHNSQVEVRDASQKNRRFSDQRAAEGATPRLERVSHRPRRPVARSQSLAPPLLLHQVGAGVDLRR